MPTRSRKQTAGGPLRVLGYVRVSTQEQSQSRAGLAAQRKAIREACATRGFELLRAVEDAGVSAKSLDRPGITTVLEELDAGKADGLVVAKLDRLSRSLLDFASLTERSRRQGWAIIALDLGVDTSTPAGEMMANVLASFANYERQLIGQRTKDALAQKRAAGVRIGRPRQIPDEIVRRIVDERMAGRTLQAIADGLNADRIPTARGAAKWIPSTVSAALASAERHPVD